MKVLIIAGHDRSLVNFRGPLIRELTMRGSLVVACAPLETPGVPETLKALGARFRALPIERTGTNIVKDICVTYSMFRIMREEKPDLVLTYTIKPVIYGSFAAFVACVPKIYAMITGLGAAMSESARWWVKAGTQILLFGALRCCDGIFAQNKDIVHFIQRKRMAPSARVIRVNGSGVDLKDFQMEVTRESESITFLMGARLLREKGVIEYLEAARIVRRRFPSVCIKLMGSVELGAAGVPKEIIEQAHVEKVIDWVPFQQDVRPFLRECHVFVLPSYYLEGIPRSILEAMAIGRAVITTDCPGCRETIEITAPTQENSSFQIGANGLIVRPRSSRALADAMCFVVQNHSRIAQMGMRGRALAASQFDADVISREMVTAMGLKRTNP
jgi:glycosyltransferase involved in cell wall biosynthesis